MRIRNKTQCGNMSDEPTGESKRPENNHRPPNNRTTPASNSSSEPEIAPSLSAKFRVVRGLKNDHSLDGEKDGISVPVSPNFCSEDPHTSGGGRLKFFKDGKFILELSHRKDGEKTCWIPVPKKTFWPVIGSPKQESSASLSVSDDNSSIQSSPWQRDHCWKQSTPRHNIGKQKEFFYVSHKGSNNISLRSKCLRRKPFISSPSKEATNEMISVKSRSRLPLGRILQSLWERVMTTSVKPDFGIVSPRKRILRELERFTLEEATKRQRARAPLRSSHTISSILAKEGESVLRTLLRSPSPESARPPLVVTTSSSSSSTSTYHPPTSHSIHSTNTLLGNSNSYYSPVTTYPPNLWPVHDPFSSPPLPLPLYYIPSYTQSWPQVHRSVPSESSSDVPLNLSKNPG